MIQDKNDFWNRSIAKTLYLKNIDGDKIQNVENILNAKDGVQVHADTIKTIKGTDGMTTSRFYCWIYYKILPEAMKKLNIDEVFVSKEQTKLKKEVDKIEKKVKAQSLLK